MIKEFKDFIQKGNVMDLAVAVILGAAFGAIVKSLVDDLIMPLIGALFGGLDFSNYFITLDGGSYQTLAQAEEAGAAVLKYGSFINAVITFMFIAFTVFLLVKGINSRKKKEEAAPATTKVCHSCAMEIPIAAKKCPHCLEEQ